MSFFIKKEIDGLSTSRLVLTRKNPKYAASVLEYLSDFEVRRYLAGYTPVNLTDIKKNLKACDSISSWLIYHKEDKKIIGEIDVYRITDNYLAEFGYIMHKKYWGSGYMLEAAVKALEFAFKILGLGRIRAIIIAENTRSIKLVEKLGFKYETFVKEMNFGGRVADANFYSITPRDFNEAKNNIINNKSKD